MRYSTLSPGARLTAVKLKDKSGEEIGKVIEWMMDVREGKIVYVVIELDDHPSYYALPWQLMQADLEHGGYTIDVDKVKQANVQVDRGDISNLVNDKALLTRLNEQYGVNEDKRASGARSPVADAAERRSGESGTSSTGPSNAELAEGKGYGG